MKFIGGLLVFVLVFIAVGVAMHFAMYQKAGVFVWSMEEDPDLGSSKIVRTVIGSSTLTPENTRIPEETESSDETGSETPETSVAEAPARKPNEFSLFNGEDLGSWEVTQFGGEGDVFVNEDGDLEFGFGAIMTGVHWSEAVPATSNYEITFDAMKLDGTDFFCALTFPVKDSHGTFVIGGWGGGVVGISCVDDLNASENETMNIEGFEDDRWYRIRVQVLDDRLKAWIDDDEKVNLDLENRKISLLPGDIELSAPLGIASFQTRAAYRNIVWKNLPVTE